MPQKIQVRRGTASVWTANNPTLLPGEIGFEKDTNRLKIGDGETAWNSLDYAVGEESAQQKHERIVLTGTQITNGYIDVESTIIGTPLVVNALDRTTYLPTDDFTVSGTRITWNTDTVGPGGSEALVEGEILHIFYLG